MWNHFWPIFYWLVIYVMADTFHSHAPGIKTTVMCATLQRGPRPQLRDAHKTTLTHRAPLPLDAVRPGTPLLGPRHNRLKAPIPFVTTLVVISNVIHVWYYLKPLQCIKFTLFLGTFIFDKNWTRFNALVLSKKINTITEYCWSV